MIGAFNSSVTTVAHYVPRPVMAFVSARVAATAFVIGSALAVIAALGLLVAKVYSWYAAAISAKPLNSVPPLKKPTESAAPPAASSSLPSKPSLAPSQAPVIPAIPPIPSALATSHEAIATAAPQPDASLSVPATANFRGRSLLAHPRKVITLSITEHAFFEKAPLLLISFIGGQLIVPPEKGQTVINLGIKKIINESEKKGFWVHPFNSVAKFYERKGSMERGVCRRCLQVFKENSTVVFVVPENGNSDLLETANFIEKGISLAFDSKNHVHFKKNTTYQAMIKLPSDKDSAAYIEKYHPNKQLLSSPQSSDPAK